MEEEIRNQIEEYIHLVPKHMHDGIYGYVFHRHTPGGFLYAILANDLYGAALRADSENRKCLFEWAHFVQSALPVWMIGSYSKVDAHLKGNTDENEIT